MTIAEPQREKNHSFVSIFSTFQDVDVDVNTKKGDWKAKHDSILDAIKEAKKTRPPSAKKDIEVQIVVK